MFYYRRNVRQSLRTSPAGSIPKKPIRWDPFEKVQGQPRSELRTLHSKRLMQPPWKGMNSRLTVADTVTDHRRSPTHCCHALIEILRGQRLGQGGGKGDLPDASPSQYLITTMNNSAGPGIALILRVRAPRKTSDRNITAIWTCFDGGPSP